MAYSAAIIALDILTDLLILVIPIYLIHQIQIKLRQKLALGVSLCLSIVIVIISITCIAGIRAPAATPAVDVTWELFWQAAEACVAVTMVSLIAFRSFFVAHASRYNRSPPGQPSPPQPKTPDTEQRRRALQFRKKQFRDVSDETTMDEEKTPSGSRMTEPRAPPPAATSRFRLPGFLGLPDIPSARLSGVLTRFTPGNRRPLRSGADVMRSNASWGDSTDRDLEKGSVDEPSTAAGSQDGDRDPEAHQVSQTMRPGTAVSSRHGKAPSQSTTLRGEPGVAELAAGKAESGEYGLWESRAVSQVGSEWELPIQVPPPEPPEKG